MIYLDNAATSLPKPPAVIDAVVHAMKHMGNSGRAAHENALDASRLIYEAREAAAQFFGAAKASQVIFTCNATEALNIAIKGLFGAGDHIITTVLEHNSVLRPLYELENQGASLSFVKADPMGRVRYEDFEALIRPETKGIVCTHASNLTGNLLDIKRIGQLASERGLLFIVDAAQTAGVFDLNIRDMKIDALCFTGHKSLFGPQGTGGLVLAEGVLPRPLKSGGSGVQSYLRSQPAELPTRLEAGTLNGHGLAGLLAAFCFLNEIGLAEIRRREAELTRRFYEAVSKIPGITVYGDFSQERAAIVSLNLEGLSSSELSDILSEDYGIATRPGAHCAPLMHEALGTVEQGASRFSFSYLTSDDDIEAAAAALKELSQ